jgi:hypothetical protein
MRGYRDCSGQLYLSEKKLSETIYVELKNPIESAVALNNERVVIRGVDFISLGALGMPLALSLDWRYASSLRASATPLPRLRWGVHYREKCNFEMLMLRL